MGDFSSQLEKHGFLPLSECDFYRCDKGIGRFPAPQRLATIRRVPVRAPNAIENNSRRRNANKAKEGNSIALKRVCRHGKGHKGPECPLTIGAI
jgi:hypothetical protein